MSRPAATGALHGPWIRLDCAISASILTSLAATPRDALLLQQATAVHQVVHHAAGTRFATGSCHVTYGALTRITCRAEIIYHFSRILALHGVPPRAIPFRYTQLFVDGTFADVRVGHASLHHPTSYVASQRFARKTLLAGSDGIVYRSVRHPGGTCLALFTQAVIRSRRTLPALVRFTWDGTTLTFKPILTPGEAAGWARLGL